MRPSLSRLLFPSLALAAIAAIAACEPARPESLGDEPPVGTQYHLALRPGTMASLVPGWPFGDDAAWGLVRFSPYPHHPEPADLRGPGLTGRAHVTWYDTTLGRVAPSGARHDGPLG